MRRARLGLALVVVMALPMAWLLPWMAGTASADQRTGPPDAAGKAAYCRVNLGSSLVDITTANDQDAADVRASCQFGPTTAVLDEVRVFVRTWNSCVNSWSMLALWVASTWTAPHSWSAPSAGKVQTLRDGDNLNGSCTMKFDPANGLACQLKDNTGAILATNGGTCSVEAWAVGQTMPTFSNNYWSGGSPGMLSDVAIPTVTACSRTLSQNNGSNVGTFTATKGAAVTYATDSVSWDWGDATTAGTALNGQHVYPGITSMPSGGWTATVTVTRTLTDPGNHAFIDGGTADKTATCSLRVDFLNPTQSTPAGTGFDTGDDPDCPSGFGWLNPFALVQIGKCLFIPSSDSLQGLADMYGEMTTTAPFSWGYEVVTFLPDSFGEMSSAADSAGCGYFIGDSGGVSLPGGAGSGLTGGARTTCIGDNSSSPLYHLTFADPVYGPGFDWFATIRGILQAIFILAMAAMVYRTCLWVIA